MSCCRAFRFVCLAALTLCLCQIPILAGTVFGADRYLIKFATVAPEGSTWMNHMRELDKDLREKSGGRVGFRIYAGGVAGDELDVLRKMRIGQIHSAAFSGVGFGQILPMVRVLDLPFLFRDYREVDLVHRELESFFSAHFQEKGFELISWAEVGHVHIFSKKPIKKVADLSPLKVWAWSGDPIAKETFTAMGTNPIPLAITDVTTALNTGMIDTVYAPPLGALALQWYTSLSYMMSLPLAHSTGAVLIAGEYAGHMPPELLKMVKETYQNAMVALTADLRAQNEETIRLLENRGLTLLPLPSGTDLQEFYEIRDHVAAALAGQIYPKALLERVYKILGRRP
jgi:TRAP-type C4-dicarboxylate transport system substrate-binding protein